MVSLHNVALDSLDPNSWFLHRSHCVWDMRWNLSDVKLTRQIN